jgi:DNA-binding response OmpR family regulator
MSDQQAEILRLRDRVSELEEEVIQLRGLPAVQAEMLPLEWRLTAQEARLLLAFVDAPQGFLSTEKLLRIIAKGSYRSPQLVSVIVCRCRAKTRQFGIRIETRYGQGFQMPQASREIVKAATKVPA